MPTIASKLRSSFGTECVQCGNELIAPKGPSIGMSDTSFIFGAIRNATALSRSFGLRTPSR
jgi:hypothetical protein